MELKKQDIAVVVDRPGLHEKSFGGPFSLLKIVKKSDHSLSTSEDIALEPFHLHNLKGKFVILYFGYTFCPDVCPLGLSNISQALQMLKRNRDQFVPLFVTVDPERDTPTNLNLYASNFDPSFIFLWGKVDQIQSVLSQYRVYAKKEPVQPGTPPENYLINHSTYIYLLNPNGQFVQQISHDMPPQKMKDTFVQLLLSKNLSPHS